MMTWKHRYSLLCILFLAYLLCYMDRMVMASVIPFIAQELDLSPTVMGGVLSAFFVGYALMQIPGGLLADRFGPRGVLTISIGFFSVLTAMTGMVSGLTALLAIRALFGVGEGPFPSAVSKTMSTWFPVRELGRGNGLLLASTAIGATVAPLFVVSIVTHWGWRSVFYVLFVPGIVLAWIVWRYVRNAPGESPYVRPGELADYEVASVPRVSVTASLRQSLKTPAVLWCAGSLFFVNMVSWGLMNWLPTYLLQARGFDPGKMGVFAAMTNFAGALGYPLGGYICDRYFSRKLYIPLVLGLVISAVFTYFAATAQTGEWAVAHLLVVFLFLNVSGIAVCTLPMVIVPKHAVGGAFGIVNTAGQLSGVLSPFLIGYVLDLTHNDFQFVLYCLVALTLLGIFPALGIRQPQAQAPKKEPVLADGT